MKIHINDLYLPEVILALFNNVYMKSEESKQTHANIIKMSPNIPGLYSAPSMHEVEEIVRRADGFIDYIGCVQTLCNFCEGIY